MPGIRAAVIPRPNAPVELRELPAPQLAPGDALLAVEWSEVCGTDVHLQRGRLAGVPYPLIPGHVTVGRLAEVRGTLTAADGRRLAEGELVTFLDVHGTCHACWYCAVAKASTRCPHRRVYGITYGADDGLCGGWADAVHLRAGTRVLPLDGADPRRLIAGGCGLPTALHALERSEVALGDAVLVLGAGPVGLSCAALARLRGAAVVLLIGAPQSRLAAAAAMGADHTLDFRDRDPAALLGWVHQHTSGRGADVVLEATGDPTAVATALRAARDAGRVVVVGQYTDHGEVALNPHLDLNRKHLEVRGCWGSDYSHFHRAVEVARHPRLGAPWGLLPAREYPLAEVQRALDDVAAGAVVKALVRPAARA